MIILDRIRINYNSKGIYKMINICENYHFKLIILTCKFNVYLLWYEGGSHGIGWVSII